MIPKAGDRKELPDDEITVIAVMEAKPEPIVLVSNYFGERVLMLLSRRASV